MNNNEEKIIPSVEETEVATEPKAEGKKLSKGALVGIICVSVALVAAIVVVVVLLAGGKCKTHVDANADLKCDNCGAAVEASQPSVNPPEEGEGEGNGDNTSDATSAEITFIVQLDNGEALSGIKFKVYRNNKTYELESGADGTVKATVDFGTYYVDIDFETLPEYCFGETDRVSINKESSSVVIKITDERPDGSASKPFGVPAEAVDITVAPGEEIHYIYHGSSEKYIRVYHKDAVICYGGNEYAAIGDCAEFLLIPDSIGDVSTFSIKNNSQISFTATFEVIAPLGTVENPIEITQNSVSTSLAVESVVYYKWVADKDGVLVVNTSTLESDISVTKVLEGDIPVSSSTNGSYYTYLAVKSGDVITIGISAINIVEDEPENNVATTDTDNAKLVDITVDLVICGGNELDPVPVLKQYIDITLDADESFVFLGEIGQTIIIEEETDISIIYNGETYTSGENGAISITLTESARFTVVNDSDMINGIRIIIN